MLSPELLYGLRWWIFRMIAKVKEEGLLVTSAFGIEGKVAFGVLNTFPKCHLNLVWVIPASEKPVPEVLEVFSDIFCLRA